MAMVIGSSLAGALGSQAANNFGADAAFLRQHSDARVLKSADGKAQVVVVPAWQGRVMTSTAAGDAGSSYGWINYDLVRRGIKPEAERQGLEKHIYVMGGEERLWLGPEGGQFAVFFKPGEKAYTFDNWKTPAVMDTEPFDVVSESPTRIAFRKEAKLVNNSGAEFSVRLERVVKLMDTKAIAKVLDTAVPAQVAVVGYETDNTLFNTGAQAWREETGLLSIWMLGMLQHGPKATIVIPVVPGDEQKLGPTVNTDYFGPIGPDRLKVAPAALFFKADGNYRSKLGVPPRRCKNVLGSYDADRRALTIVQFNLPKDAAKLPYVRSQWKVHTAPYAGDVINAYNDGAPEPGAKPLGPFYELESSSPARPLPPGKSMKHVQCTIHLEGAPEQLEPIAQKVLGVSLKDITTALP